MSGFTSLEYLHAYIRYGDGFDLMICGFATNQKLKEIYSNLKEKFKTEQIHLNQTTLYDLPIVLPQINLNERSVIFVGLSNLEDYDKKEWSDVISRLNERRNITFKNCFHTIVLYGPSWFPLFVQKFAPDIWSIRTSSYDF
jgi:hypothetical protein